MQQRPPDYGSLRVLQTISRTIKSCVRSPRDALDIERRSWGMYLAEKTLRRRGLAQMYDERPSEVYAPDWVDLLNIYGIVRRRKPKVVLEFGSGCSTLMFARALADNRAAGDDPGHIYSVETSPHFKAQTESYLPPDLRPFVDILTSDIQLGEVAGERVMWHSDVPDVVPNLIYLDGPDYQDHSPDIVTQADGVILESKAAADCAILVDGREMTYQFTKANLKRRYALTTSRIHKWELFEPAN